MPRQNSLKSLCVETVIFIGLFAMAGHLSVNFWERYLYQTELANMKCSLHTMKETINHIGYAYDNLQTELKEIMEKAERKSAMHVPTEQAHPCKHRRNLERRRLHDLHIQSNVNVKNDQADSAHFDEEKYSKNSKMDFALRKNATTITRYPPKSTGVGSEPVQYKGETESCSRRDTFDNYAHKCYKELNNCGRPCNHLKF